MLEVDMLTATTEVLANGPHYGWGGPGPFFFIFPLLWFLLFATVIFLIARRARRGPRGGWGGPWAAHASAGADPVTLLGNRFARGEIDEAEYRSRLAVLRSEGPTPSAGPSPHPSAGPTATDAPPAAPTPQDQPPADDNR
jgi:putative membrane protein